MRNKLKDGNNINFVYYPEILLKIVSLNARLGNGQNANLGKLAIRLVSFGIPLIVLKLNHESAVCIW